MQRLLEPKMKIIFFLLFCNVVFADDSKSKYIPSLKGKLIGGLSVGQENYKFTASLRRKNVHFCTATLLSKKKAITAAFCIKDFLLEIDIPDFDLYTLVAGRHDVHKGLAVFKIEEVTAHRKYNFDDRTMKYAIGLITMRDNDIIESEYVGWAIKPITKPILHTSIDVTGWKNISDSIVMKQFSVQIVNKNNYHISNRNPIICAVQVDDNETLSEKDLGAPLSQEKVIIGVLIALPESLTKPFVFIDVYRSHHEITRLMNQCSIYHKHNLPRKKARYDNFKYRHLRKRCSEKNELVEEQILTPHNKLEDISEHIKKKNKA